MNIIQMVKSSNNPQQVILNLLENEMQNTPMGANLLALAKQNRTAEIEQIARNLMQQQGKDFDTEFQAFRKKFGL